MTSVVTSQPVVLPRKGGVELPFFNKWGEDVYVQHGHFSIDPVTLPASSTSGSPVLLHHDQFVGFLDFLPGGQISADHDQITITPPPGGRLFVCRGQDPDLSWSDYNNRVLGTSQPVRPAEQFHDAVEYCTWVEQKERARSLGMDPLAGAKEVLDHRFVADYLERIAAMGLPPGKVTIDVGWFLPTGYGTRGDWLPDTRRFPSLARTASMISDAGHVPGLWFAPGRVDTTSKFYLDDPAQFISSKDGQSEAGESDRSHLYALPNDRFSDHYRKVFRRYNGIGFRKFKLDMHYGSKSLMREQLQRLCHAIKETDPGAEVEHHIPDIFVSRYADTIRTNDVLIAPGRDWRGLTAAHFRICARSSPDKILNLDHIGGNDPSVKAEDFLTHSRMYSNMPGHPVISLLPDRFGDHIVDQIREQLWQYHNQRTARI